MLINENEEPIEQAKQLQTDLRHLFARRARDVLHKIEQIDEADIVIRKKLLSRYFELYKAIDTIDEAIDTFLHSPEELNLDSILDKKSLDIISP